MGWTSQGSGGGKKKMPPMKPSSPDRRGSTKLNKVMRTTLTVRGYPIKLELINVSQGNMFVGEKEAYTNHLRKHVDGDVTKQELTALQICGCFNMRVDYNTNLALRGFDGWKRFYFIRILGDDQVSTEATRQQLLAGLSSFLKDEAHSMYPPSDVIQIDNTDETVAPTPLDHFLLDADVVGVMGMLFPDEVLTKTFATDFPEIAGLFFGGPRYPQMAVMQLGYGTHIPGVAPGFVLPPQGGSNPVASNGAGDKKEAKEEEQDKASKPASVDKKNGSTTATANEADDTKNNFDTSTTNTNKTTEKGDNGNPTIATATEPKVDNVNATAATSVEPKPLTDQQPESVEQDNEKKEDKAKEATKKNNKRTRNQK